MATAIITSAAGNLTSSVTRSLGINSIPFAGSALSSILNSQVRSLGTQLGNEIDSALSDEVINKIKGPRLTDLTVQTSTYGDVIPLVFGRIKLSGNVIWASDIKEIGVTNTINGGGKGGSVAAPKTTQTQYQYKVTFAVALCEGEITGIERVWADNDLINLSDYCTSYTLYKGDESQMPDTIIESYEGIGNVPAYRGMAYIVFEDFDLNSFGNRIPNLAFEVNRTLKGSFSGTGSAEDLVTAITLIPGSGEFVYDTIVQKKIYGVVVNDTFIQRGGSDIINMNNASNKADVLVSLDMLQETFPNLEWVSIVCAWFADSLDANAATIKPGVEYKENTTTTPDVWSVGGYDRDTAKQITVVDGSAIYGGTPNDQSIIRLIDELKSRGLKVMFYPMLFVDNTDKPWRGHITTSPANIPNFFTKTYGYNDFILHYANLVKNKADAFIIGSELKGLTQVQDGSNNFPAVAQLVSLAGSVKSTMGSYTKITYAADWSEYHSVNGWYNMDGLWASSNIDMIGIDAYFPLTNRPQNGIYDVQEVIDGWTSGEGYDYYYNYPDRITQNTLGVAYAWKNIAWWWGNHHTNPNSVQTSWVPQSKKIWFTEFGFPSVDGATNQPNVFYNPESTESALPYFSEGYNDFSAQRLGIEATLLKWQNSNMIEEKFLWTWDARPYPFWPDLLDVWSDGSVWSKGHWVNGKLGQADLGAVVKEISTRSNIEGDIIDISCLQQNVDGFILNTRISGAKAIEKLKDAYFFNGCEIDEDLRFITSGRESELAISEDDLADIGKQKLVINYISVTYLPSHMDVNFIKRDNNYGIGTTSNSRDSISIKQIYECNFPLVIDEQKAKSIAEISVAENWLARKLYKFYLPLKYITLDIGDLISLSLNNGNIEKLRVGKIIYNKNYLTITGKGFDSSIYEMRSKQDYEPGNNVETSSLQTETVVEFLDLPALSESDIDPGTIRIAACGRNSNWHGAEIFYSFSDNFQSLTRIETPSVMGNAIDTLPDGNPFIFDENTEIEIYLLNGELTSVTQDEVINGSNLAIIGDEIIQFSEAEFIEENRYMIKGLLRGRYGTEDKTSTHVAGERFILLDQNIVRVELPKTFINSDINFKAVTFGQNINDVDAENFHYRANNLIPLSPVYVTASKDGSGDINISWERRSREFSGWHDYVDIPLAEGAEKYVLNILDGSNNVIRTIQPTDQYYIYLNSEQISDFGGAVTSLNIELCQFSQVMGNGIEKQANFSL